MEPDSLSPLVVGALWGALFGLIGASFAGHFGYRSADRSPGESRMPHCVFCLRPLRWFEFAPLGWLIRRSPHRFPCPCGKQRGLWAQPLAEMLGGILGAAAVVITGNWTWALVPVCLGLGILPAMAMIDLFFGLIPDELNLALGFFGLIALLSGPHDLYMGIITSTGLLAFGLFLALGYSRWRGREMLGLGDVKLFAAAGLWLPLLVVPWFLMISGAVGALFGFLWKRAGGGKEFPFAPALCASLAGCILYSLYQWR